MKNFIGIDDKLPLPSLFIFGVQHVLALFSGLVAVPLIVGSALQLPSHEITILVQGSLITSGAGTLVQCLGVGRLGARLPICMGSAFVFIAPSISVGQELGIQAVFGAAIVSGVIAYILSFFIWRVQRLIPTLVTGTVVVLIGLSLLPLGFTWLAGGEGELYGEPISFFIGGLVLVLLLITSQMKKGLFSAFSVIIAITGGYILSAFFGLLDLSHISQADWVSFPNIFHFGMPTFSFTAIVTIFVAQLASTLESIGNTYGTGAATGRKIGKRELSGSISADGLMSAFAAFFNGFSLTCFAQNIGVINITKIASRFAVAAAGIVLILLGLIPKFSAIISGMPAPVLGGASMVMFGSIVGSGVLQLRDSKKFGQREIIIFATSIALGLGFGMAPEGSLEQLPSSVALILESGVAVGGFSAILLNKFIPKSNEVPVRKEG
jgi:xanthine permease